jgi:hypothetical protein
VSADVRFASPPAHRPPSFAAVESNDVRSSGIPLEKVNVDLMPSTSRVDAVGSRRGTGSRGDRERLMVSMRVSRRGLFGSLPRRTFCRASPEGRRRFSASCVGCYRNAHKMFRSFEDLVTDLSVYLFCMQDDLSCPPSRKLSGFFDEPTLIHQLLDGRLNLRSDYASYVFIRRRTFRGTSRERVTEKKLTRPVPV